eukprot:1195836-Prorocentrum_minimum.AAC.1
MFSRRFVTGVTKCSPADSLRTLPNVLPPIRYGRDQMSATTQLLRSAVSIRLPRLANSLPLSASASASVSASPPRDIRLRSCARGA